MNKIIVPLVLALSLAACSKPSEQGSEQSGKTKSHKKHQPKASSKNVDSESIYDSFIEQNGSYLEVDLLEELQHNEKKNSNRNFASHLEYSLLSLSQDKNKDLYKSIEKELKNKLKTAKKSKNYYQDKNTAELAELLDIYSNAYSFLHSGDYRDEAEKVFVYIQNNLISPDGAFYASESDLSIYPDHNGLLIEALVNLYRKTMDTRYLEKAMRAADSIVATKSFASDDVFMASAFLSIYEASASREWLARAKFTADYILKESIRNEASKLSIANNIKFGRFLNKLYHYSTRKIYKVEAIQILQHLSNDENVDLITKSEPGVLILNDELSSEPLHITIVGSKRALEARKLFKSALTSPLYYSRIEWFDSNEGRLLNHDVEYPNLEKPAAFTCKDSVCSMPIYKAKDLRDKVKLELKK